MDDGIVTFSNEVQPLKTLLLISITDAGIFICFKAVHFSKAASPILFTDAGIVTFCKFAQKKKEPSSIEFTEEGIEI